MLLLLRLTLLFTLLHTDHLLLQLLHLRLHDAQLLRVLLLSGEEVHATLALLRLGDELLQEGGWHVVGTVETVRVRH